MTRLALTSSVALAALLACSEDPVVPGADAGAGLDAAADVGSAPADASTADAGVADSGVADGGVVEGCGQCHGTADDPAPPPDLSGSSDRSRPGVGAHSKHRAPAAWHNDIKCDHCHVVPAATDLEHGQQGGEAVVTLKGLAAAGVTPSYENGSCSVYCHGAKLKFGEAKRSPEWTSTAGTTCTSCHGMPPPAPHPDVDDCGRCHLDVSDENGAIISGFRHIDGYVTAPKGAHLIHLEGAGGPVYECVVCHDGERYHGLLKDGKALEETTACDGCHPSDAESKKAVWETWKPE
ncbi:MAG: CxxxxCH/CxxCH domain-containing protein [Deltaproteobacteria bacterium]|nr:CxxxxCH/CxxCH domain-containing protein [Deltaproteobacteria bacterium]